MTIFRPPEKGLIYLGCRAWEKLLTLISRDKT